MQNAKDTFYVMLRDRIATGNPARTIAVRGVERPAVLVEENELPSTTTPTETFVLRWTSTKADARGGVPLLQMECAIRYETAGSDEAGGMNRGRSLATMDAELVAALLTDPPRVVKTDVSALPPVELGSNVFWTVPVLGDVESTAERLGRTTTTQVYSLADEAGSR